MHESQAKLGARFFETVGWERPFWYESNAGLLEEYGDAVMPREHEWDARWWSPIINAEHLRMREAAGVIDLSAFCLFDIEGPGALEAVQTTCVAQCDVAVGKVIYTPVLDAKGGFRSDLTVMRLGEDHFRVVTGGAHGMADRAWFAAHVPDDGATTLTDHTDAVSTIGVWGPRARDIVSSLTDADVSDEGFGFLTCREVTVGGVSVLASRISYVGELGWELYVAMDDAAELWETLLETGSAHGAVPVGIGVYGTTGRIEKGYRAYGAELDGERSIVEAGMQRPKVKAADFVGKEAYLAQRAEEPRTVLCTLAVDDHTSASGVKRYMLGGEPILTRDGGTLTDGHGHHPYVTSAGSAPSLGKHLLLAYLPPDRARVGNELAVSYMEERYPVTVVSADATPALDPENARRGEGADVRVLVCVKRIPDVAGEVMLTADAQAVDARFVGHTVSNHESSAVELAIRVADATGGSVSLLSVGPAESTEQLRHMLGLGCHAATLVEADPTALGPADVAREIAVVVTDHGARGGADDGYDLVLLGNDAGDSGDFQVGIRLAYALGWPVVNGVSVVETAEGRAITRNDGPEGEETFSVPLPAVVTVLEGGVEPRYPTLKGRMAAKKVEIETRTLAGEPAGSGRLKLVVPPPAPSDVEVLGQGPEAAARVVDLFASLGVLR